MIDFGYGVELGPLRKEALTLYRTARNNYSIWKWCRQNDVIAEEDHLAWFERQRLDRSIKMYEIRANDECVGVCGLTDIDQLNQRAEFSLYVMPEFWGHGYGRAGLSSLLEHGFRNLNLNSIFGETYSGNKAAKTFEKLGFVKEGTRRQFYFRDGKFIDCHLYSMTRDEWNGQS